MTSILTHYLYKQNFFVIVITFAVLRHTFVMFVECFKTDTIN